IDPAGEVLPFRSAGADMRTIALFLLLAYVTACSSMVRGSVNVRHVAPINESDRQLVMLSQTSYTGDLAAELGPYGFRIRPLVRQRESDVAMTDGGARVAAEEGVRYGLQIEQKLESECAFTSSSIYAFVITVIDIENNEVVMVVRQTGADGPCTTVKSVWPTVARAIAENWKSEVEEKQ